MVENIYFVTNHLFSCRAPTICVEDKLIDHFQHLFLIPHFFTIHRSTKNFSHLSHMKYRHQHLFCSFLIIAQDKLNHQLNPDCV